jgi:hypothetical protein
MVFSLIYARHCLFWTKIPQAHDPRKTIAWARWQTAASQKVRMLCKPRSDVPPAQVVRVW